MTGLVDRAMHWSSARERTFVEHPERRLRLLLVDLLVFAVTFACWMFWSHYFGTWVGVVIACIVGFQLGRSALLGVRRATTYRSGWLAGRSLMIQSFIEAGRRGMTVEQWSAGELSRELYVLGMGDVDADELIRRLQDDEP